MNINIEIGELDLKKLIMDEIHRQLGDVPFLPEKVIIEVKSKQNYKAEWETANFRAKINIEL